MTSTGKIPADYIDRLESLGAWLKQNGDAIYGSVPWLSGESLIVQNVDGEVVLTLPQTELQTRAFFIEINLDSAREI